MILSPQMGGEDPVDDVGVTQGFDSEFRDLAFLTQIRQDCQQFIVGRSLEAEKLQKSVIHGEFPFSLTH